MSVSGNTALAESSRFRWLDRWLEPRWRALLTWVALAMLTFCLMLDPMSPWVIDRIDSVLRFFIAWSPLTVSIGAPLVFERSALTFLWCWFPPIILRVGVLRTITWIAGACAYRSVVGYLWAKPYPAAFVISCILLGLVLGLPGLAVTGRRSRPWMSLIGGVAAGAFLAAMNDPVVLWWPERPIIALNYSNITKPLFGLLSILATHLIYGTVGKATGGRIAYGWCYVFHLGPFGTCMVQGPTFRYSRGPRTRRAVIALVLVLTVASGAFVVRRVFRNRAAKHS